MLPDVVMISGCAAERTHIKDQTFREHEGLIREQDSSVLRKDIIICISFNAVSEHLSCILDGFADREEGARGEE